MTAPKFNPPGLSSLPTFNNSSAATVEQIFRLPVGVRHARRRHHVVLSTLLGGLPRKEVLGTRRAGGRLLWGRGHTRAGGGAASQHHDVAVRDVVGVIGNRDVDRRLPLAARRLRRVGEAISHGC